MKLIVTIDTEEDNWSRYSATDNPIENIERVPDLQRLFDEFAVRPTYLVTYPVATNPRSVAILRNILEQGRCEIGMHCHPWNTPPFDEKAAITKRDTMLCNLPEAVVHEKMTVLHEAICKNFGIVPVSFRAGRWGFSAAVARSLHVLGYRVDTSVSPFINWGEKHGPDFSNFQLHPYRFDPDDIATPNDSGVLLEIPATVGFLQGNFERCQRLTKFFETSVGRTLCINGILRKLKLINKAWLSPETSDLRTMIRLAERIKENKFPCVNMFFHSTSLIANLSSFVKNKDDEILFIEKIGDFLRFSNDSGFESITLSQMKLSSVILKKTNLP